MYIYIYTYTHLFSCYFQLTMPVQADPLAPDSSGAEWNSFPAAAGLLYLRSKIHRDFIVKMDIFKGLYGGLHSHGGTQKKLVYNGKSWKIF